MLQKKMYVRLIISFWILLIFSDSSISVLKFAHLVKPIIMITIGTASIFLMLKKQIKNSFIFPFILFFTYVFISVFFHPNFFIYLQKSLSYFFIYFSPPIYFILIQKQNKTNELLHSIIFFGNLILLISILLGLFAPELGAQFGNRLNGVFRNPNGIGIFIALYGILAYVIFKTIEIPRKIKRFSFMLIVIILFLSGSRSALGALMIFMIGTSMAKKSSWFFVIFSIAFYFIYHSLYDLAIASIYTMGYSDLFRLETIDMASGRIYVWQAAKKEIMDNLFFFGGGFNYSESKHWLPKYYIEIPDLIQHQGNVHQSFLSLWMNNGLIGLSFFLFGWLKNILISLKKTPLTLPIFAALVFSASYESWLIASLNPFTIQLVLIFSIILLHKNNSNPTKIILDAKN